MSDQNAAGIPMSVCCPTCGASVRHRKYNFARLEIGEQLLLPLNFAKDPRGVVRIRGAAFSYGTLFEKRFSVKTVENGALVKRVA